MQVQSNLKRNRHQKTALDFMTQRENGPISESYRLWRMEEKDEQLVQASSWRHHVYLLTQNSYKHVVTNAICMSANLEMIAS